MSGRRRGLQGRGSPSTSPGRRSSRSRSSRSSRSRDHFDSHGDSALLSGSRSSRRSRLERPLTSRRPDRRRRGPGSGRFRTASATSSALRYRGTPLARCDTWPRASSPWGRAASSSSPPRAWPLPPRATPGWGTVRLQNAWSPGSVVAKGGLGESDPGARRGLPESWEGYRERGGARGDGGRRVPRKSPRGAGSPGPRRGASGTSSRPKTSRGGPSPASLAASPSKDGGGAEDGAGERARRALRAREPRSSLNPSDPAGLPQGPDGVSVGSGRSAHGRNLGGWGGCSRG